MTTRLLVIAGLALTLSGCGIFNKKDDEELLPLELQPIQTTVDVKRVASPHRFNPHSPVKTGFFLSKNACTPALKSLVWARGV